MTSSNRTLTIRIVALGIASLAFLFLYFQKGPLVRYWYHLDQYSSQTSPLGNLELASGLIKKQENGSPDFFSIQDGNPIFQGDYIMTGSESAGLFSLEDGSKIEVGPKALVRFKIEPGIPLLGIGKKTTLEVASGNVKFKELKSNITVTDAHGNSKLMQKGSTESFTAGPGPIYKNGQASVSPGAHDAVFSGPLSLQKDSTSLARENDTATIRRKSVTILAPSDGSTFNLPNASKEFAVRIPVKIETKNIGEHFRVQLVPLKDGDETNTSKLSKVIKANQPIVETEFLLQTPGPYALQIENEQVQIQVNARFKAIHLKKPSANEKNVILSWSSIPQVKIYQVFAKDPKSQKLLFNEFTDKNKIEISKYKMLTPMVLSIEGETLRGFIATSNELPHKIDLPPPSLISPADNKKHLSTDRILFTWKLDKMADGYEIQMAADPEFHKIFFEKSVAENFIYYRPDTQMLLHWRVRSKIETLNGPFSIARRVNLKP